MTSLPDSTEVLIFCVFYSFSSDGLSPLSTQSIYGFFSPLHLNNRTSGTFSLTISLITSHWEIVKQKMDEVIMNIISTFNNINMGKLSSIYKLKEGDTW